MIYSVQLRKLNEVTFPQIYLTLILMWKRTEKHPLCYMTHYSIYRKCILISVDQGMDRCWVCEDHRIEEFFQKEWAMWESKKEGNCRVSYSRREGKKGLETDSFLDADVSSDSFYFFLWNRHCFWEWDEQGQNGQDFSWFEMVVAEGRMAVEF